MDNKDLYFFSFSFQRKAIKIGLVLAYGRGTAVLSFYIYDIRFTQSLFHNRNFQPFSKRHLFTKKLKSMRDYSTMTTFCSVQLL